MTGRRVDEAALEAALCRWARAPAATAAGEAAACARIIAHGEDLAAAPPEAARPGRRWWPLAAGAALAASVALVMVAMPRPADPTGEGPAVADAPEASFALLYTPMDEEVLF